MKKILMLSLATLLTIIGCTISQVEGDKTSEQQDQISQESQGSFDAPATIVTMEDYEIHAYSFVDGEIEKINETTSEIIRPQSISWTESPEVQSLNKEFFYLYEIRKPGDMIRPLEETQIIKFDPFNNTKELVYKHDGSSMVKRWKPTSEGVLVLLVPPVELYDSSERESQEEYAKLILVGPENKEVEVISENILALDSDKEEIDPYLYSEIFHPSTNIYSLIVDKYFSDGKTVTTVPYLFQYDVANGDTSIKELEFMKSPTTASLCHQGDNLFWQDYIPRNDEGELIEIYKTYQTNLITGETKLLSNFDQKIGVNFLFCKDDYIVAELGWGYEEVVLIKDYKISDTFKGILLNANDHYIVYDSTDDLNSIEKIMIYNVKTGESVPLYLDIVTRKVYLSN
ncbi:MAG: hypothetical protein GWP15_00595 [Nitrospirae bacterium]|nr:hypothetical protein [Nitrospirota bacterium]